MVEEGEGEAILREFLHGNISRSNLATTLRSAELSGHDPRSTHMLEDILSFYFVGRSVTGTMSVHLCVDRPRPSGQAPALLRLLPLHRGC